MLGILNSNQPVAWAVVPVTGCILFLVACSLDLCGADSWTALAAVILSARLIHLLHAESGMRTRPGSIPGWVWVLFATPFIGVVPDASWWCMPCLVQGLRLVVRLRDTDGMSGTFFYIGLWWGLAVLVGGFQWPLIAAMLLGGLMVRRPDTGEGISAMLGLITPAYVFSAAYWVVTTELPTWWTATDPAVGMPMKTMAALALPVGAGWVIRQQSMIRATAQQRFSRQLTQWAGAFGALLIAVAQGLHWMQPGSWGTAAIAAPGVFAFLSAWSLPWLMPPGLRTTSAMPYAFILMSMAIVFARLS